MAEIDQFETKSHRDYITLYYKNEFICNCDNWKEVEEEKHNIIGY